MSAKVTQAQADAYLDGWGARHNEQGMKESLAMLDYTGDADLTKCFTEGYEDCNAGTINFEKVMGPNDFQPEGP